MNSLRAPRFTHAAQTRLERVADWPSLPARYILDRVVGVALDSRDNLYVAHRGDHPLLRFHPDGQFEREVGPDDHKKSIAYDLRGPTPIPIATRTWLHGLRIDPWDNVWITDVSRHLVMKFDSHGNRVLTLGVDGESGCTATHFFQPTDVCVVPSGEFFVTDGYGNSRVVKFDPSGRQILEWGRRGTAPGEFHTPHAIVLGQDGMLYVTDRENDRIQIFDQEGNVQAVWNELHSVDGICVGPEGAIYGSAGIDNALLRFNSNGKPAEIWSYPETINYPHGIAVGRDGALYVAETGDRWVVTGRAPADRQMLPRSDHVGSAVTKFLRITD